MKLLLTTIILSFSLILASQPGQVEPDILPANLTPELKLHWVKNSLNSVNSTSQHIQLIRRELGYSSDIKLDLVYHRTSQTLEHYHYQLSYKGFSVFGGEVHLALYPDGRPKLIQAPKNHFSRITGPQPNLLQAMHAKNLVGADSLLLSEIVLIYQQDELTPVVMVEVAGPETLHRRLLMHQGKIIYNNDLHKHLHQKGPNDTSVSVMVFDPDPLTTAQKTYSGAYVDNSDRNNPELDAERQPRTTTLSYRNGLFLPENDYVKITEFSGPITAQSSRADDNFDFSRDKDQFEDINVIYHVTHFREHIISLGYPSLPNYQVQVDAHALSGSDQSFFSTTQFPYRLYFGEGGVDDAEDADVILHEFGHAVIYEAAPTGSKDTERKCIEEAICDYFAASYSRSVSSFMANDVFNWDGHNEFWPGREVSTGKTYQQASFKNGNFYADTDLIASSLNEILLKLGRRKTDQLVLEACYFMTSSTTMPEFARYLLISDTLLNAAVNLRPISEAFVQHGILSKVIGLNEWSKATSEISIAATHQFSDVGSIIVQANDGIKVVRVFDINGRLQATYQPDNREVFYLEGSPFEKGVYVIEVESTTGDRLIEKLLRH